MTGLNDNNGIARTNSMLQGVIGCALLLASGCGSDGDSNRSGTDSDSEEGEDAGDSGTDTTFVNCPIDPELANRDAADLFDWPTVPTFDIYLPPDDWTALQESARDEEYVEAEACFEGVGIGTVGIRFKGAYGSLYSCFNENDENICRKLGIKLKFSEYDKEGRFFGMKRLNFQGNRYDDSYMKETLSYALFRSMDIVTPRASWAEIRVNDVPEGLFGMVEQIDGRFTANRWPDDGDGNLYKEVWPINTNESYIVSRLKTNEETAEVSNFVAFSEAMLDAETADLGETLGSYMDLDYLARYMAVDDAIANFDGITAYYIDEVASWQGNHNFYIYEEAADAFTMIPWDLESTFSIGGFGPVPHWTEKPEDCSQTYNAWTDGELKVIAPGCDPVFEAMGQDLEQWRAAGEELLSGAFGVDEMGALIDEYIAFIEDAVEADPNGPGLDAFISAATSLKTQIPRLRTRFEYLLTGESWVPFEISVDEIMDFEAQDDAGLIMGPGIYINPTSTVAFSINTENPMYGEKNLVIDFEFDDGEQPWDQWLNYIVPIADGARDVTDLEGIRLSVRADQSRPLRMELNSSFSSATDGWLRMGWDIPADEEIQDVEVRFEDATIPQWAISQGIEPASPLDDVLTAVSGLLFGPQCIGRDNSGYLPGDTTDIGFVEIDNIEFF